MNAEKLQSLSGLSVLITRPRPAAELLGQRLAELGAKSIVAPMIEIFPNPMAGTNRLTQDDFANYAGVIFISENAVHFGYPLLRHLNFAGKMLGAVGKTTAAALTSKAQQTAAHITTPQKDFSSEGLLALPDLQAEKVCGQRFLLVRGNGGRELLADTIRDRGGFADYLEVYIRRPSNEKLAAILKNHQVGKPSIGVVTSVEGLNNLAEKILRERLPVLFDMPLVVGGARIAAAVKNQRFTYPPLIADNPGIEGLISRIADWVAAT